MVSDKESDEVALTDTFTTTTIVVSAASSAVFDDVSTVSTKSTASAAPSPGTPMPYSSASTPASPM